MESAAQNCNNLKAQLEQVQEIIKVLDTQPELDKAQTMESMNIMLAVLTHYTDELASANRLIARMLDVNEKMRDQHSRLIEQNRSLGYLAAMHLNHTTRANA